MYSIRKKKTHILEKGKRKRGRDKEETYTKRAQEKKKKDEEKKKPLDKEHHKLIST